MNGGTSRSSAPTTSNGTGRRGDVSIPSTRPSPLGVYLGLSGKGTGPGSRSDTCRTTTERQEGGGTEPREGTEISGDSCRRHHQKRRSRGGVGEPERAREGRSPSGRTLGRGRLEESQVGSGRLAVPPDGSRRVPRTPGTPVHLSHSRGSSGVEGLFSAISGSPRYRTQGKAGSLP